MVARLFVITTVLSGFAVHAPVAHAQSVPADRAVGAGALANTRGLHLGFLFGGGSADVEDSAGGGDIVGFGFGLRAGWGFTRTISLLVSADVSSTEGPSGGGIGSLEFTGRYSFLCDATRWVPYVETGIGTRRINSRSYAHPVTSDTGFFRGSGSVLTLGGGVQWFESPSVAVDVGYRVAHGKLASVAFDGIAVDARDALEMNATSAMLSVAFIWYPMTSRNRR